MLAAVLPRVRVGLELDDEEKEKRSLATKIRRQAETVWFR
jgi:hypothetical protein